MKKHMILMASLCTFSTLCADGAKNNVPVVPRQGEILSDTAPSAYNMPAAIAVGHKMKDMSMGMDDMSFFVDAAFTYWYISQEGMRVATNAVLNGTSSHRSVSGEGFFPNFKYQPGFKVALGMIAYDEWQYTAGYTWTHTNIHTHGVGSASSESSIPANTTTTAAGTPVFIVDDWFFGLVPGTADTVAASSLSSKWNLTMNIVDLTGGRPFYQGKSFVVSPFGGLELAFISQHMNVHLTEISSQVSAIPSQPIESKTRSNSWGVGPTAGCQTMHLLPWDFYATGKGAFALLYTTYTTLKHTEDQTATTYNPGPYEFHYHNYHAMRPSASMELGLGWGSYLADGACYLDFSATYEFAVYWAQNMIRKLVDDYQSIGFGDLVGYNQSAPAADLFTQGLTVTGTINF